MAYLRGLRCSKVIPQLKNLKDNILTIVYFSDIKIFLNMQSNNMSQYTTVRRMLPSTCFARNYSQSNTVHIPSQRTSSFVSKPYLLIHLTVI
jgi:hypothetical protein